MEGECLYDVFLSHSAKDKAVVRAGGEGLKRPWSPQIKMDQAVGAKVKKLLNQ